MGEGVRSQTLRRRPLSHGERDRVRGATLELEPIFRRLIFLSRVLHRLILLQKAVPDRLLPERGDKSGVGGFFFGR